MARFYGEIRGRGTTSASRTGSQLIEAHVRGWKLGVKVQVRADGDDDWLIVYRTGGSDDPDEKEVLYKAKVSADGQLTEITYAQGIPLWRR